MLLAAMLNWIFYILKFIKLFDFMFYNFVCIFYIFQIKCEKEVHEVDTELWVHDETVPEK